MNGIKALTMLTGLILLTFAAACSGGASPSDHYQAGLIAAQEGDWETARREFDAARDYSDAQERAVEAQQNSATVGTAYDQAKDAIESEEWYDAYSKLNTVVALSPDYEDASRLLTEVTQQLDKRYETATAAIQQGDFVDAIAELTAIAGYKDAATQLADVSDLQAELAALYGAMKQYALDKDFARAAQAAGEILQRSEAYKDVQTLISEYKEQLYSQSSELFSQNLLREALEGFESLAGVDPAFKDVQERIGQTKARLETPQPGVHPVGVTESSSGISVILVSIEVLPDGQMRVNERVRNNRSSTARWSEDADGGIYIMDEGGNRYVPIGWGTPEGPRQLGRKNPVEIGIGQEVDVYVLFPALKDASETFSFTDEVEFSGLSIAP